MPASNILSTSKETKNYLIYIKAKTLQNMKKKCSKYYRADSSYPAKKKKCVILKMEKD